MTPLVFATLKAHTPNEIETKLIDERIEPPRDLAAKMDFGQMISIGTDRMAAHLKTLQAVEDNG
jgi:hypothetical protein